MKLIKTILLALTLTGSIIALQTNSLAASDEKPLANSEPAANREPLTNQTSLVDQMKACSSKTVDSERLQCFDLLAQELSNTTSQTEKTQDALPDTLGGGKFDTSKEVAQSNQGTVTSCKKSVDGRWFFIFENGQIWKQSNHGRRGRRYKDCRFPVTINKDGFGYKMNIESLSRKIRVKRIK